VSPERPLEDLETRPIPELIANPLLSDHRWLLAEFDRLIALSDQVETLFGAHEHVPEGLGQHLKAMRDGLARHIDSEEQVIFPAVVAGNANEIRGAIRDLELEHQAMQRALARMRVLTSDLSAPDDANDEWRDLYLSLTAVEARIQRHAHIEDHILFPRVFFEQPDPPEPGQDHE
jgi:regulator of cell morphogenesis and NO signaling